ncbi:MAG: glutathione peroxidase [Planctomyces sp.]|jgi:glutathione peroxidase|nr:glutathione peroxidase [Planctomyces sp.]
MRNLAKGVLALALVAVAVATGLVEKGGSMTTVAADAAGSIYKHKLNTISGEPVELSKYKGKVILFVNVASACGYTGQYKPLQAISEKYKEQGLEVVGVPCNQFGGQEPGSADEIQTFCSNKYGVTFDLLAKTDVNGPKASPLYVDLKAQSPNGTGDIGWNFEKFLVSRDGKVVGRYKSGVKPDSKELVTAIEAELAKK